MSKSEMSRIAASTSVPGPAEVLYIAGYGHSGSTILNILLGQHEKVLGAGELFRLASAWQHNEYCSCGKPLPQCQLWRAIVDRWSTLARTDPIRDYPACQVACETRLPLAKHERSAYAHLTRSLFAAAREVSGKSLIVDASKLPQRARALMRVDGLEVRLVHLVRDARGVAWSLRHRLPKNLAAGLQSEKRGKSVVRTALLWAESNLGAERAVRQLGPARASRITYEDFVTDPTAALAVMGEMCGIDFSALSAGLARGDPLSTNHVMAGNRLRMNGGTALRPDFRWRQQLPWSQRRLIETLCAPLLYRYGYLGEVRS